MRRVPRFYFTVRDSLGETDDYEGANLTGVEAAILHAATAARSMMSDSIKRGQLELDAFIEIEDKDRIVVARLYFEEAINGHYGQVT